MYDPCAATGADSDSVIGHISYFLVLFLSEQKYPSEIYLWNCLPVDLFQRACSCTKIQRPLGSPGTACLQLKYHQTVSYTSIVTVKDKTMTQVSSVHFDMP